MFCPSREMKEILSELLFGFNYKYSELKYNSPITLDIKSLEYRYPIEIERLGTDNTIIKNLINVNAFLNSKYDEKKNTYIMNDYDFIKYSVYIYYAFLKCYTRGNNVELFYYSNEARPYILWLERYQHLINFYGYDIIVKENYKKYNLSYGIENRITDYISMT